MKNQKIALSAIFALMVSVSSAHADRTELDLQIPVLTEAEILSAMTGIHDRPPECSNPRCDPMPKFEVGDKGDTDPLPDDPFLLNDISKLGANVTTPSRGQ